VGGPFSGAATAGGHAGDRVLLSGVMVVEDMDIHNSPDPGNSVDPMQRGSAA
jgi:hypothetical protein